MRILEKHEILKECKINKVLTIPLIEGIYDTKSDVYDGFGFVKPVISAKEGTCLRLRNKVRNLLWAFDTHSSDDSVFGYVAVSFGKDEVEDYDITTIISKLKELGIEDGLHYKQ